MGFKEALIPIVFFVISVIGIAQTAITVKTYLDTGKPKDSNFNFSAVVLTASIIGLFASGFFAYKAFKGEATAGVASAGATSASEVAGSKSNLGAQEMGLANKLENVAANSAARAEKAKEGARLANALGATLGQLKKNN